MLRILLFWPCHCCFKCLISIEHANQASIRHWTCRYSDISLIYSVYNYSGKAQCHFTNWHTALECGSAFVEVGVCKVTGEWGSTKLHHHHHHHDDDDGETSIFLKSPLRRRLKFLFLVSLPLFQRTWCVLHPLIGLSKLPNAEHGLLPASGFLPAFFPSSSLFP